MIMQKLLVAAFGCALVVGTVGPLSAKTDVAAKAGLLAKSISHTATTAVRRAPVKTAVHSVAPAKPSARHVAAGKPALAGKLHRKAAAKFFRRSGKGHAPLRFARAAPQHVKFEGKLAAHRIAASHSHKRVSHKHV